jgi:alanyl-tRNA synthetase
MTAKELREKFLKFMESKGHTIIPSASLVPENDPSVLFTTAGMHPLVPYLLGENHPGGSRVANVQKCIRTVDIDEVGDTTHHTFFEMLGNWSFGDYFKKEAIEWSWKFLIDTKCLGLDKNRIAVSVFKGDEDAPFDEEAYNIWKEIFEKNNLPIARIAKLPKENNWWGMETGPCGPDSEMFYWVGNPNEVPKSFNDDNDLWVECWNDVFMEFNKLPDGKLEVLKKKNVDTGMGMERMLAAMNGCADNYRTELFCPIIDKVSEAASKSYNLEAKSYRIIADHIKAAVFMIADGVIPSNVQRGYVLRRLIRRAIRHAKLIGIENKCLLPLAAVVVEIYRDFYPELHDKNELILSEIEKEENKFRNTLEKGLAETQKMAKTFKIDDASSKSSVDNVDLISGDDTIADKLFELYTSCGFPIELAAEELKKKNIIISDKVIALFNKRIEKHQALSRTASVGMFKGGLADSSEETKKLHTAAHLLLAALRKVLGENVFQKGSNITAERLRFDFSYSEKMTPEQIKKAENLVNDTISKKLPVECQEMSLEEAKSRGAMGVFESKYGEKVKVYSIGEVSNEICGGPHVENTGTLGKFKITKEESSSAGVRRIKAILE